MLGCHNGTFFLRFIRCKDIACVLFSETPRLFVALWLSLFFNLAVSKASWSIRAPHSREVVTQPSLFIVRRPLDLRVLTVYHPQG